jgi:hypothetical protein
MDGNYDPENDKKTEEVATEETTETKTEETATENAEEAVNVTENPVPMLSEDVVKPNEKTDE